MWPALPTSCSRRRRRRRSCKTNNFGQKVQVLHVTICTKPRAEASPTSRRATRHEERELESEMEKRQPQLPSCNTIESKSFCCRSTASAVEGAHGRRRRAGDCLRAASPPPISLAHTHTHTSCACGGPICFGVPVPVAVPAWSWLCLWLWLGRGLAPVATATATASEAAAAARGYGATWSLGHGHNKLPTTGAKCSIMLTSYSVKTTKKHNNNNTRK